MPRQLTIHGRVEGFPEVLGKPPSIKVFLNISGNTKKLITWTSQDPSLYNGSPSLVALEVSIDGRGNRVKKRQ
ncbi:BTE_collapsed_G0004230.mRNA.1.CDS.1 [Saccharomyces cerevisiae]|nr:BTE_collapsed_G0004230.mRNA.1.CDS.1 [Saccharomyces cerevisiae]